MGLEKIKEKILSEARADAEKTLGEANTKVADIMLGASERADRMRAEEEERAEKEAGAMIARSASAAEAKKRAALTAAKSAAVDRAYALAYDEVKTMPREKYVEFVSRLVALAVMEEAKTEDENIALYGAEEAELPESYEVVLNKNDREEYGEEIVTGVGRVVIGKLSRERIEKITLSHETADIDGGAIVRFGGASANMSLSSILRSVRERTEADVMKTLFP